MLDVAANRYTSDNTVFARPADCQSATQQIDNLRYGVIGGRDIEAGAVSVRLHHGGPQGVKAKTEVVAENLASIKERRA
jgi:hypothetical protein